MNNKDITCDSCQSAPSTVYCRADSAYLCAGCDAEVHANLISHRHVRTPIVLAGDGAKTEHRANWEGDEDAAAWWFLDDPARNGGQSTAEYLLGGEVEEYMGLMEYSTSGAIQEQTGYGGYECVVPVQSVVTSGQQQSCHHMEMEYEVSSAGFCYTPSLSHSVSLSSMEASSIVPDTAATNIPNNAPLQPLSGTANRFSGPAPPVPTQFTPMDRQARVLRYREKKKTRKFDKTVRYASRKAYAEKRPRIKGRFARRSDIELEVDQMFSNYEISQGSYGIVPSFDFLW